MLTVLIAVALLNAFFAGFHGSAAVVATVISSRALPPRLALALAAAAACLGPLVLGTAVADTFSRQLVVPGALSLLVLVCGLAAAISWVGFTWAVGLPCSASQALVGGLLGAVTVAAGPAAVLWNGLLKVLIGLFISPPLGLLTGLAVMAGVLFLAHWATPRANQAFKQLQLLTSLALALVVGSNDAQKLMGLITLGLVLAGRQTGFAVPVWVSLASAGAFALGMLSGGYRLIRTLGGRIFRIRPVHAFSAQLAATAVISAASLAGLPVSSTQVISTAIFGVGSAQRVAQVRWQVAGEMIAAWALTIPATAVLAGALFWILKGWVA
ncbi:MAG: inorganic phosphate transporter [Anaerolineales bacterium]|nr:inorganic phosphate transporter [Anaerolineales bacterium]